MAREADVVILNQTDLRYLLIDALKMYSEDVEYISGNNPYLFNINKKPFYIFIHNLHDSGFGRGNKDESRIQISKSKNFLAAKASGKPVLIFGYSKKDNTFTAWNPFMFMERINKRRVVSLYSRFTIQQKAVKDGIAEYEDNNKQKIISFRPEHLGLYLENYESMHQSDERTLLKLIKQSEETEETEDKGIMVNIDKKKFIVTHKRFKRDVRFKKLIYDAYKQRCAICGIQLELIEAAHIVPYSNEKGNDDPKNGVCLCVLHHKAYDQGLIFFDEEYNIKINENKIEYLEKMGKDGGIQKFLKLMFEKLMLPTSKIYYPSKEYIKIANKIRGII
jgi:putative restriction endonuclease